MLFPDKLYHWTERNLADKLRVNGFDSRGVYLTSNNCPPHEDCWSLSIYWLFLPTVIEIDVSQLKSDLFAIDANSVEDWLEQGWDINPDCLQDTFLKTENIFYQGAIPVSAITGQTNYLPHPNWKYHLSEYADYNYSKQEMIDYGLAVEANCLAAN